MSSEGIVETNKKEEIVWVKPKNPRPTPTTWGGLIKLHETQIEYSINCN